MAGTPLLSTTIKSKIKLLRVASLEEELTRKEERWNATFSRLKNKAETKEKECEELHQQITVLEQEKIALWEKEVSTKTKRIS